MCAVEGRSTLSALRLLSSHSWHDCQPLASQSLSHLDDSGPKARASVEEAGRMSDARTELGISPRSVQVRSHRGLKGGRQATTTRRKPQFSANCILWTVLLDPESMWLIRNSPLKAMGKGPDRSKDEQRTTRPHTPFSFSLDPVAAFDLSHCALCEALDWVQAETAGGALELWRDQLVLGKSGISLCCGG